MKNISVTIYLRIAGFYIQTTFASAKDMLILKDKFESEFYSFYSYFILKTKPKSIHYSIEVKENNEIMTYITGGKIPSTYFELYKKKEQNKLVTFYHIGFSYFQIIIRFVLQELLSKHGFILHASAIYYKGSAMIFPGKSGAGKSTIISLLKSDYAALAHDSLIIKKEYNKYYAYQTPFWEKGWWIKRTYKRYPINKIIFIYKRTDTKIIKLYNNNIIFQLLLKNLYITDKSQINLNLKVLTSFSKNCDFFYKLYFERDKKMVIKEIGKN